MGNTTLLDIINSVQNGCSITISSASSVLITLNKRNIEGAYKWFDYVVVKEKRDNGTYVKNYIDPRQVAIAYVTTKEEEKDDNLPSFID